MSALVREQIEGITPAAVSMIPPDKFAVSQHLMKRQRNICSLSSFDGIERQSYLIRSFFVVPNGWTGSVGAITLTAPYVFSSRLCQLAPLFLYVCPFWDRWCFTRDRSACSPMSRRLQWPWSSSPLCQTSRGPLWLWCWRHGRTGLSTSEVKNWLHTNDCEEVFFFLRYTILFFFFFYFLCGECERPTLSLLPIPYSYFTNTSYVNVNNLVSLIFVNTK